MAIAAQFTFIPRASVGEEWTDNFLLSETDLVSENITTAGGGFTAGLFGEKYGLDVSYDGAYASYANFSERNNWRHSALLNFSANLSKHTRFNLNNRFVQTENPAPLDRSDVTTVPPGSVEDPTIRRSRQRYWRNTFNARVDQQFGRNNSLYFSYQNYLLINEDPSFQDSIRSSPAAGITFNLTNRWGISANVSFNRSEFEIDPDLDRYTADAGVFYRFSNALNVFARVLHEVADFEEQGVAIDPGVGAQAFVDYTVINPTAGFTYVISDKIDANFEVGYFIRDFERGQPDEPDLSLNARLNKRFKRGSIRAIALSGYNEGFNTAQNLGFNRFWEAALSGSYQLSRYVNGTLYSSYRNTEYLNVLPDRTDRQSRVGGGLDWSPLRWLSLQFNYTFRNVDSTIETNKYTENRLFFSIRLSPVRPYQT
ncbi:hypothetical protein D3OALGA1CA_2718 [Olavius algarvensis associated proteobacterium Delta 3]|nr:hypothetical protein D3OALGB2SA_2677 [Olavius algarvensis associated proteobacterium Delta 3]CAB5123285.1 hypothetical protein D3OALGA1CA_2718 [Olavius algarvensis associated proteobacterium Delta 3]